MPATNQSKHIDSRKEQAPTSEEFPKGKNYLFAIAIDEYEHCPHLYNAVKDAEDLIAILTEKYCFEKANVIALFNEKATEAGIIHSFRDLARSLSAQDNLLIYFSGHGEYDEVFKEGYWLPVNAKQGAFEDYIPNSKIRTVLNAMEARHIFLVSDSCFSGSLFMQYRSGGGVAGRLEKDPSRWGLTAGRNEIVEDGHPGSNSPFADSLIYHLKSNDKALGVAELCTQVVEDVVANANQTPRGEPLKVEGHRGGLFYFHLKKEQKESSAISAKKLENQRGSILYNVPETMELDRDTRCEVRIAFDKATLTKDLEMTEAMVIKDIRISNLMGVELMDPSIGEDKPFSIRQITESEQFIDSDDYTQWIFYVKALKEGEYPLILKVTVIEFFMGKERKREIVLEETVKIVTRLAEQIKAVAGYKAADYFFSISSSTATEDSISFLDKQIQAFPGGTTRSGGEQDYMDLEEFQLPPTPPPASRKSVRGMLSGVAALLVLVIAAIMVIPNIRDGNNSNEKPVPPDNIVENSVQKKYRNLIADGKKAVEASNFEKARTTFREAESLAEQGNFEVGEVKSELALVEREIAKRERLIAGNQKVKGGQIKTPRPANPGTLKLTDEEAWQFVKKKNIERGYQGYLDNFPQGKFIREARLALNKIKQTPDNEKVIKNYKTSSGTFKDKRNGRTYAWIKVKNATWMAENLDLKIATSWCYENKTANCKKYGRLYTWEAARKACPRGWHLPSDQDWLALKKFFGGTSDAYKYMISGGEGGLNFLKNGKRMPSGRFTLLNDFGCYWSGNEVSFGKANYYYFDGGAAQFLSFTVDKKMAAGCRCVKD